MIVTSTPAPIDKSRCAAEPIHIPGSIQPHGLLFVLSETTLIVTHVSANVETMLGISATSLLGGSLSGALNPEQAGKLEAAIRRGDSVAIINPMRFTLLVGEVAVEFECVVHHGDGTVIVELEPWQERSGVNRLDLFAQVRTPIARMDTAPDIAALVAGVAVDVRAICGFDRVMVYRFDEEWNGDVLAESTSAALPVAYLGLRFPAGDIPEQARRLYVKNMLRLIADVDFVPSPLVPSLDAWNGKPVDLSGSILRSSSPIHLEYLRNMGVRSTLTISIVLGGRLWGLIACHHLTPRRVDYVTRASCEFFGQMLAWQIGSRLLSDGLEKKILSNARIGSYEMKLGAQDDLATGLVADAQSLLDIFAAQGLAIRFDGVMRRFGETPPDDTLVAQIAAGLYGQIQDGVAASHRIGALLPAAVMPGSTSGALLITLSEDGEDYLVCFRDEVVASVNWGGDVRTAVTETDGILHPRSSFALWQEVMRGQSTRWSADDIIAAHSLRERIFERSHAIVRRRAEERVRHLARHDTLTSLPNRASFHDALREMIDAAERETSTLAVLFIDLDHFKLFNDAFGHGVGDLILQAAAARMTASVRHGDVVARLGGDEFVIILPKLSKPADAETIARKVLGAMSEPFVAAGGTEIRFTASVGIAVYPQDSGDADALLQHADLAMYRAKERGRNSFQRFDVGDSGPSYEHLTLERRIEEGLANGEFVPFYQPLLSLQTGRIASVEALARWKHPDLGLLPPAKFIAVAEESRLIVTLGESMLRAACADCARWRKITGSEQLCVSVNVSARQFRDREFIRIVNEAVAESGLAPGALELELTESLLIEDEDYTIRTLRMLAAAGISIVIDDFGTGYSSLSYLKRLPVTVLKIDQSFIRDLTPVPDDSAIVRAIIAMAHSLRLRVVAEGVETVAQLDILRAEGCDTIQGYLIAKPLAKPDVTKFLETFEDNRRYC